MLKAHAVDPDLAAAHGVYTAETVADLSHDMPDYWDSYLPAVVYPWRLNGRVEWQLAPRKRDKAKYRFRKDAEVPLNCLRDNGGPILLVEGTKQQYAALTYAPPEFAVYGMDGCYGWTKTDPTFAKGRLVVPIFDADFRSNRDVHDAAGALRDTLRWPTPRSSSPGCPAPGARGSTTTWPRSATTPSAGRHSPT
jgi:hypothetical protein